MNKNNFLIRLKKHDEHALEFVIEEYGGLLLAIIRKHLYCLPGMQEECMNDVLFKIWKHIGQFDETKSSFKNWIAGIARYQSIDYLRKYKKSLEEVSLEDVCEGKEDEDLLRLLETEISEEVENILSCLSDEDKTLFLKLFYEEKDTEQVSLEMGIKKENIYNRVSRGKRKIRLWKKRKEEN